MCVLLILYTFIIKNNNQSDFSTASLSRIILNDVLNLSFIYYIAINKNNQSQSTA